MRQGPTHVDVRFMASRADPELWTDPGWQWLGSSDSALPTFIRSVPKKRPGFLPAGLDSTPVDARTRWQRDEYRYPHISTRRSIALEQPKGGGIYA